MLHNQKSIDIIGFVSAIHDLNRCL